MAKSELTTTRDTINELVKDGKKIHEAVTFRFFFDGEKPKTIDQLIQAGIVSKPKPNDDGTTSEAKLPKVLELIFERSEKQLTEVNARTDSERQELLVGKKDDNGNLIDGEKPFWEQDAWLHKTQTLKVSEVVTDASGKPVQVEYKDKNGNIKTRPKRKSVDTGKPAFEFGSTTEVILCLYDSLTNPQKKALEKVMIDKSNNRKSKKSS